LRLSVLSSGSSGNATYIESGGRGLLVDAGFSCRRLRRLLARIGCDLDNIEAVLITHGHTDHTSGVRSLVRECGVCVYAARGVWEARGTTLVEIAEPFEVCGMSATFFEVPHDAPTCGLRISGDGSEAALATDLGEITPETLGWMRGAQVVVLEANHDPEWLRRGPYTADLKRRILATGGHLSNWQAAEAAIALAPHGLSDLVLAHLSETNNTPVRACGTVSRALREAGYGGVRVRAALRGQPTPWIEVGQPVEPPEYVYRYVGGEGQLFGLDP
jgi:phosphoribosyl 1,2-cyclic phosphodiesterase